MAIKKFFLFILFTVSILFPLRSIAIEAPLGQVLQINTRFNYIYGEPSWLLIIRDMKTGQIIPYLFDLKKNDNFWVAFTAGRTYRVTASNLKFGPCAKISNFCGLENGVLTGKSMWIMLSGTLSPDPRSYKCHVSKYRDDRPSAVFNTP